MPTYTVTEANIGQVLDPNPGAITGIVMTQHATAPSKRQFSLIDPASLVDRNPLIGPGGLLALYACGMEQAHGVKPLTSPIPYATGLMVQDVIPGASYTITTA